ncbi:branched-chain amino acid ABC transporter permease [Nocardioides sp. zg-536]|uniref:Branched-chain amino acid ABC transporter permease n=1 Tax=Nocardioides faecalis TaxID=2803858 RepID=A0A938Y3B1_9ACTN|nr:branched-chain amino acid ABC transporter permease [Nocardioides faecalis]MBM9458489.1 branched-chain amino acid ABC transporter permease [Nocardioides faecalis]MBS4752820.1 branched-chain amino acid ABC transporter permease [Nocardioides faecalis]QVI58501.1 branched-chain amino acid ABC transporter permease [Nocardioides faecalis]
MSQFLGAVIGGLGLGSIYALLALGFVIIYKSMGVISFAQPAFLLAGTVLVTYLTPELGFALAVLVGAIAIAGVALVVERVAIRPMVGKAVFVIAIITIGVDIIVRILTGMFVGSDQRSVGDPWGIDTWQVGGVYVEHRDVAAFAVTSVLVLALFAFFRWTPIGLAMRASALDQEAAMAQGVSVGTVFAVSWGLAGALATVAGVFAAAGRTVDQNHWHIALLALPVIILGGLDSLGGAVLGGLLIGVAQQVVTAYHRDWFPGLDTNVGSITPYVVMLVVLLVRPYGLFGTREVARV